jgi:3-dehydroquinate synthase
MFKIDNISLIKEESSDIFDIKSHPLEYNVCFQDFKKDWDSEDCILIDSNIKKLYDIKHNNIFELEATESNKSIETCLSLCDFLLSRNFNKKNVLHVIGGGITQDIGAFTSKIYKRGINWVYYPTTLLSQCDSCIGGKTALNFNSYKNQLALFSAPTKVIIDIAFLKSLKKIDYTSGMGEIVKLFITGGESLLQDYDTLSLEEKIKESLMVKKGVIEYDEFELNIRKSLNYGHTFGHAIESLSKYAVPHGLAVILGIYIISKLFPTDKSITEFIERNFDISYLNTIDHSGLLNLLKTDKKALGNQICFVHSPKVGETNFIYENLDVSLEKRIYEVFTN